MWPSVQPLYSVFALNGTRRHNPGNDKSALTTLSLAWDCETSEEENAQKEGGGRELLIKQSPLLRRVSDEQGAETGALAGTGGDRQ